MLTNNEIRTQIENGNIIIDNLKPFALDKPNSCSVGIEDLLYTFDYSIVDIKDAKSYLREIETGQVEKLRKIRIPKNGILLEPRKVYLAKTREHIKTNGYVPVLHGRTALSLLGTSIELNSGYSKDKCDESFLLSIICTKPTIIYPNIELGNLTFFQSLDSNDKTQGMLSGEEIKRRMRETGEILIMPEDNIVINPNSVNLTLNKSIAYYTSPILDMKKKNPLENIEIGENGIILYPNEIYLGRTNEWTETNNLVPMMSGRSSLGRLGYHVHCSAGMGSFGYRGYWHLGIRPSHPIEVLEGMKCCQIYYFTPEGEIINTYNGSMQNLKGEELGSQFYTKMLNVEDLGFQYRLK